MNTLLKDRLRLVARGGSGIGRATAPAPAHAGGQAGFKANDLHDADARRCSQRPVGARIRSGRRTRQEGSVPCRKSPQTFVRRFSEGASFNPARALPIDGGRLTP